MYSHAEGLRAHERGQQEPRARRNVGRSIEMTAAEPGAPAYRVWCEDCELDIVEHDDDPPWSHVDYHKRRGGDLESALEDWSAYTAAKGEYDGHKASNFRDYEAGLPHRVHMEAVEE